MERIREIRETQEFSFIFLHNMLKTFCQSTMKIILDGGKGHCRTKKQLKVIIRAQTWCVWFHVFCHYTSIYFTWKYPLADYMILLSICVSCILALPHAHLYTQDPKGKIYSMSPKSFSNVLASLLELDLYRKIL